MIIKDVNSLKKGDKVRYVNKDCTDYAINEELYKCIVSKVRPQGRLYVFFKDYGHHDYPPYVESVGYGIIYDNKRIANTKLSKALYPDAKEEDGYLIIF